MTRKGRSLEGRHTQGQDGAPEDSGAPCSARSDRRAFLKSAGTLAATVPPAMTFLLSTTLASSAIAKSGAHSSSYESSDDDSNSGGSGDFESDSDNDDEDK